VLSRGPKASAVWEYYPARQRATRDPVMRIRFDDGLVIDERLMRILVAKDSVWNDLDLNVFHPEFESLDEHQALDISLLFLANLLGEDEVERWVGHVTAGRKPLGGAVTGLELREMVDAMAARPPPVEMISVIKLEHRETGGRLIASWRTGLKRLDHLYFDHHVEVVLELSSADERGLCDSEELEILAMIEDELLDELGAHAVFFGHVTGQGKRSIRLQTMPMSPATSTIERWIARHPEYEIDYSVTEDPAWKSFRDISGSLARP
jgi:hypothetical protein